MTQVKITYQVIQGNSKSAGYLKKFESKLNAAALDGFAIVQMTNDRDNITAVMERLVNADES